MTKPQDAGTSPYGRTLRRAHLAILSFVCALAISGAIFYFRRDLGLRDYKIELMTVHSFFGYGLIATLIWRAVLGLRGEEGDRLRHVIVRASDITRLIGAKDSRTRFRFAGRSPLSRLLASALYLVIASNVVTGLVFAATDLYHPPIGPLIARYVAADGRAGNVEAIRDGDYDKARMETVRKLKRPVATVHLYGALTIGALALFHAGGGFMTEWRAPGDGKKRGRAQLMLFGPPKPR